MVSKNKENIIDYLEDKYKKFENQDTKLINKIISFPELEPVYRKYIDLKKSIGENVLNPIWSNPLKIISKFRFLCSSTILPPKNLISGDEILNLQNSLKKCEQMFIDSFEVFEHIQNKIIYLSAIENSPYLKIIDELKNQDTELLTLVYKSDDYLEDTKKYLKEKNLTRINVINQKDFLYSNSFFGKVLIIGHYTWFNPNLFSLPNAEKLYSCHFDFHGGKKIDLPNFITPFWKRNISNINIKKNEIELNDIYDDPQDEVIDITFNTELTIGDFNHNPDEEKYHCLKTLLAGNNLCFLCCEEGVDESQDGLFFLENGDPYIEKIKVKKFESGDYVCLRLGSDKSLTTEIADKLMEIDGKYGLRKYQQLWKEYVKKYLRRHLKTVLENKLYKVGVNAHLNYWTSEKCIKTSKFENFEKIMNIVNEDKINLDLKEIWAALKKIDSYHQKAGNQIKRGLKKSIENDDLSKLFNEGFQIFKVADTDASIGVYRIEKIAKETTEQYKSYLDKVISIN